MSEIDRDALNTAIERGLAAIWAQAGADGAIDGANHGGPLYSGIALVTRAQLGELDDDDRTKVVAWVRTTQLDDGSYPASPCATKGTLDSTAATYAGMKAAGVADDDPAQQKAKAYIDAHGGWSKVNPMYYPTLGVAGLIAPEDLPSPHLFVNLVPFMQTLMGRHFNQWIGMSADLNPLITQGLLDHGQKPSWFLHPLLRLEEKRVLDFLKEVQNPGGTLSGVLIYTAQLASAFELAGVDRNDEHFAAARAALTTFRVENEHGMEYQPFVAGIWNTAEAIRATMRAGGDPAEGPVKNAIAWLLDRQTTEPAPETWQNPRELAPRSGGWPFEATNVRNPDCDTTGAALHALAWVLRRGEDEKVRVAMNRGVDWLKPMQNDDGGWPSMTRGVGSKPPGPFFEEPFWPPSTIPEMIKVALKPPLELQDPATAAMTGRIVRALADCGVERDDPQMKAALEFMKVQQWKDAWWGRWEVNWIAGTAYGLIGVAGTEASMKEDWVQRAADFIVKRQNGDGGFGEGTETYRDFDAKGPFPSRADLTGKAIQGLVDAGRARDESTLRAAQYLLDAQKPDGTWKVDDGEYVILPPDLFYTNPMCNLIDALEGLVMLREALSDEVAPNLDRDWSDEKLDRMRRIGDPAADAVVKELFEKHETAEVQKLFHMLTKNDAAIPDDVPEIVRRYFEQTEGLPAFAQPAEIKRGEEAFGVHGMSMICGLFCSSLPHAYAAHRGATVLVETGRMVDDFTRRIVETAQFVMDVMQPGGLAAGGEGLRTIQKVRLIHAAVRHMLLTRRDWDVDALGVPLNQEDLAGTLLTFSVVILDALDIMGIELKAEEKRAYLHSWRCVGHVLGIRDDMIPKDLEDAYALYAAIQRRQFAPSEQGKVLTKALIDAMEGYVPGKLFDGAAAVYVRKFLGDELADGLGVPATDWTRVVFEAETLVARLFDHETERSALLASLTGHFERKLMQGLSKAFRGGKQVEFRIPTALKGRWKIE